MNITKRFSLIITTILVVISCARQGSPTGGPKDEIPPVFVNADPDTLSTNVDVNLKEAVINFDEYIVLKEYNKNVVVSPSFQTPPIVTPQAMAKKYISIKFQEPLLPNTTYSFNFGDAVQDFNENNKLSNFQYVFSTGSFIDSLSISGHVNSSYDFQIPEKVLVGLYKVDEKYNDSIIMKKKPYYIARANEKGEYKLNYLASGKYKIVAFEDKVENVQFDYGKEKFAFVKEPIELAENKQINLNLYNQKPGYRKPEASFKGNGLIVFKTFGATDEVKITPVSKQFSTAKIQSFPEKDSINFWFNPSIDTITAKSTRLTFKVQHKDKEDDVTVFYTKPSTEYKLEVKPLNADKLAPNKAFKIQASAPIVALDLAKIHLFKGETEIPFKAKIDSLDNQIVNFEFEKALEEKFEVNIYPKALTDILGAKNDTLAYPIKMGTKADFGHLKLALQNAPTKPFILQFLKNDKDFTILEQRYETAGTTNFEFNYIEPGDYLFRLLVDENGNGKWDTGDFLTGIQPEPIYLYPAPIKIRAIWDAAETWILGEANQPVTLPKDEKDSDKNRLRRGELKEGEERVPNRSTNTKKPEN